MIDSKLPNALIQSLTSVRQRLAALTAREKALVAAGLAIALATGLWLSYERLLVQSDRLEAAEQELFQLRRAASRPTAPTAQQSALVEDLRASSLQAANMSLARLAAEQFVVEAAASAGVVDPSVVVSAEFEEGRLLNLLRVEVSANYSAQHLLDLLEALSSQDMAVMTTVVDVTGASSSSGGRMRVAVLLPVELTPETEA